jgi:hypothetical protein
MGILFTMGMGQRSLVARIPNRIAELMVSLFSSTPGGRSGCE